MTDSVHGAAAEHASVGEYTAEVSVVVLHYTACLLKKIGHRQSVMRLEESCLAGQAPQCWQTVLQHVAASFTYTWTSTEIVDIPTFGVMARPSCGFRVLGDNGC